jgi:uncharacterized protein YyaL (SSP411 family)
MPNRLIDETSPYLRQHAHNPVDWHPWGPEALERAKSEDKPILLSVGYSACHWCHVMERESFENPSIAALMNEHYVSIKVDREERPDIDSIYMSAVQALTGHGGWPMTVFLTPDGKPFYGGTYFPPEDRGGMPAFPRVLSAIAEAYHDRRGEVMNSTNQILVHMQQVARDTNDISPLTADVMTRAFAELIKQFDDTYGGFGLEPKFPQPMTYEFLLRQYLRTEDPQALDMVELTLDRMARGGIYDQLSGGFHRYSTDTYWLVPHFEKMLYDNALLVRLYLHAYQVTRNPEYRRVVEETLDYVVREMTSPEGGFYSAQDADSEGEEGKFFVWRPEQVVDLLGKEEGKIVNEYYGVTIHGNFEGKSILHVPSPTAEFARKLDITESELNEVLARSKKKLLEQRATRIAPGLDDKILTAWNGLMLAAFAEAAAVLGRDDYREIAITNGTFLLDKVIDKDGRLLRTYKDGKAKLNGYLEDYAFLIDALLLLHETTFGDRWLIAAVELGRSIVELFWDEDSKQFYDTGIDHEDLVIRPRDTTDNAIPSGSSMATSVLLKLSILTGDSLYLDRAATALRSAREIMQRFPSAAGHWLGAFDFYLARAKEVVIVGRHGDTATRNLTREVYEEYLPNRVFIGAEDGPPSANIDIPLFEDRHMVEGRSTAYVCENYVCLLPVNDPAELAKLLAG